MCLGIPMKVISLAGETAVCERDGIRREVALQLLEENVVQVDDYVVVHLGFAIERIHADDAKTAKETWDEWSAFVDEKSLGELV